jgi:hypothetical protein
MHRTEGPNYLTRGGVPKPYFAGMDSFVIAITNERLCGITIVHGRHGFSVRTPGNAARPTCLFQSQNLPTGGHLPDRGRIITLIRNGQMRPIWAETGMAPMARSPASPNILGVKLSQVLLAKPSEVVPFEAAKVVAIHTLGSQTLQTLPHRTNLGIVIIATCHRDPSPVQPLLGNPMLGSNLLLACAGGGRFTVGTLSLFVGLGRMEVRPLLFLDRDIGTGNGAFSLLIGFDGE